MKELLLEWFKYWHDFFRGLESNAQAEVWGRGDTPIFDQLEREWIVKDGKWWL